MKLEDHPAPKRACLELYWWFCCCSCWNCCICCGDSEFSICCTVLAASLLVVTCTLGVCGHESYGYGLAPSTAVVSQRRAQHAAVHATHPGSARRWSGCPSASPGPGAGGGPAFVEAAGTAASAAATASSRSAARCWRRPSSWSPAPWASAATSRTGTAWRRRLRQAVSTGATRLVRHASRTLVQLGDGLDVLLRRRALQQLARVLQTTRASGLSATPDAWALRLRSQPPNTRGRLTRVAKPLGQPLNVAGAARSASSGASDRGCCAAFRCRPRRAARGSRARIRRAGWAIVWSPRRGGVRGPPGAHSGAAARRPSETRGRRPRRSRRGHGHTHRARHRGEEQHGLHGCVRRPTAAKSCGRRTEMSCFCPTRLGRTRGRTRRARRTQPRRWIHPTVPERPSVLSVIVMAHCTACQTAAGASAGSFSWLHAPRVVSIRSAAPRATSLSHLGATPFPALTAGGWLNL